MKHSLVSVVIPTHNRAALLQRAIRSVQCQTYSTLEIIVVDDASRDSTQKVVEAISDSRIRYLRHDVNKGGSAARNTGIRAAMGEFIAFLDDDDEWMPEKTAEQLRAIEECEGCDAVTCTSFPLENGLQELGEMRSLELGQLLDGKFTWGGTGVLLARAKVLKQTMFDETLPRYQDWDLFIRIALNYRIAYLNKPLMKSGAGAHPRITNSVLRVPIRQLEEHYRMLHKHKTLFGAKRFHRHMAEALLFGIKHRDDKIALLAYTTRRYGIASVVRALAVRVGAKVRDKLSRGAPVVHSASDRGQTL